MSEYTAAALVAMIRERYHSNDEVMAPAVVLEQVPDATGSYQNRWIDAAVFQLWPMKGLTRAAFEVKISRNDLIQELLNPAKHAWCKECFHEFWIVAPQEILSREELPASAGWLYPRGDKLVVGKMAPRNDSPRLDDKLLAAFMRAASKEIDRATKAAAREALAGDREYQRTVKYAKAAELLLEARHCHIYYHPETTMEEIYEALQGTTMGEELKQARTDIDRFLDNFQTQIIEVLGLFMFVAQGSLKARDGMSQYLYDFLGKIDSKSLAKLRKRSHMNRETRDRTFAALKQISLAWGEPEAEKRAKK